MLFFFFLLQNIKISFENIENRMQNTAYPYINGFIHLPFTQLPPNNCQEMINKAIGFALSKSLTLYSLHITANHTQNCLEIIEKRHQKSLPQVIEIEEQPQKLKDGISTKSDEEQVRTSQDTPPMRKKLTGPSQALLEKKNSLSEQNLINEDLQNQSMQVLSEGQSYCEQQEDEIIPFAKVPDFGMDAEQIYKRRIALLQRKVRDWKQIEKIDKMFSNHKRELKRLMV